MSKLFDQALAAEGVTGQLAQIARSIYMQESSGGKNTKTSNAGAMGGMQIIPSTFNSVADKGWSISDPMHNARAGIRYIQELSKFSGGDPALTAVGYYGGPGAITKAKKGIAVSDPRNPNAPTTLEYGQQVASRIKGTKPLALPAASPVASVPAAQPTQSMTAAVPAPVAQGATVEVPPPGGPDTWSAFLAQAGQVTQPQPARRALAPVQYEMPQMVMPDFMGTVAPAQATKPNISPFAGLASWGVR